MTTRICTCGLPTACPARRFAGPLLGALRTVRKVERLADTVESLPDDRPVLALLDGTLAFWDLQRGQYLLSRVNQICRILLPHRRMLPKTQHFGSPAASAISGGPLGFGVVGSDAA